MGTYVTWSADLIIPREFQDDLLDQLAANDPADGAFARYGQSYYVRDSWARDGEDEPPTSIGDLIRWNFPVDGDEEFSVAIPTLDPDVITAGGYGKLHPSMESLIYTLAALGVEGFVDCASGEYDHWRYRLLDGKVTVHYGRIVFPDDFTLGREPVLPMPGEPFHGGTVIASTWQNDDPGRGPVFALLMLLMPRPPYYDVLEITFTYGEWKTNVRESYPNINPATAAYADRGGDY